MNVMHLWVLWFALKRFYMPRGCKMSSRPRGYDPPNKARTWKPPVQGFHSLVKIYSKESLIFSKPTAFLSVPLSWADREVDDSHGNWIQKVWTCFHGTQRCLPFIDADKDTDDLVPRKTESVYIKKRSVDCHCAQLPEMCVISCSTSAVAASPMVERTESLHLHIVYNGCPAMSLVSLSFPLDVSLSLHVHCIGWGETVSSCRW